MEASHSQLRKKKYKYEYGKGGDDKIRYAAIANYSSEPKHACYKKLEDLYKMLHLCRKDRHKML